MTLSRLLPPWQAIKEWIPDDHLEFNCFNQERQPKGAEPKSYDQSPTWQPKEIPLGDGRIVVPDDSCESGASEANKARCLKKPWQCGAGKYLLMVPKWTQIPMKSTRTTLRITMLGDSTLKTQHSPFLSRPSFPPTPFLPHDLRPTLPFVAFTPKTNS